MERVRVKICGVKTAQDALCAAMHGADAIGLVFCEGSPRTISIDQARLITSDLPPFISVVGLFMNSSEQLIRQVLNDIDLDIIQFHGDEPPEECRSYGRPYIKAVPMKVTDKDNSKSVEQILQEYQQRYYDSKGFVVDSHAPGESGGSGETFDWNSLPHDSAKLIILAGGLNPDNVAQAIKLAKPFCVDVSSGVESQKGVKDHQKIAAFIRGVNSVS
ncbi:MAG: phosphoribosylanthranilate isomerase [Gammaproteobacteria bacterium]|nr:MAG: phosphoribosylanthranilate isomerase [Gammaproteobacteria bacterium]